MIKHIFSKENTVIKYNHDIEYKDIFWKKIFTVILFMLEIWKKCGIKYSMPKDNDTIFYIIKFKVNNKKQTWKKCKTKSWV